MIKRTSPLTKHIIQASFFWKNDTPCGLGFSFGPPTFSPADVQHMFAGDVVKQYMRDSDKALGTSIVSEYLAQLEAVAQKKARGEEINIKEAILCALNIIWLTDRGFLAQDEFNGYQFAGEIL